MKLTRPLAFLALTLPAASAFAWDATGHMIVASIAFKHLNPRVRAEVVRIMAAGAPDAPTDFILAGPWADEYRNHNRATGPWHYEDHHFRTDGKPVTTHADAENAVWAIERFTKILSDRAKPLPERAEALRFLIHFVGDIHQPLHATARDSAEHPNGDRGGNDFAIQAPPGLNCRPNLHSLWDLGAGLFAGSRDEFGPAGQAKISREAAEIEQVHPRGSIPHVGDRNPEDWALESFEICKKFVYSTPEGQTPSGAYLAKAREVSAERVAAAGYRLADLLDRALGS